MAYLLRRGAIYYVRRRIPPELQPFYGKKRELWVSLKTADPKEARSLRTMKAAQIERDFSEKRALLTQMESSTLGNEISETVYRGLLLDDDDARESGESLFHSFERGGAVSGMRKQYGDARLDEVGPAKNFALNALLDRGFPAEVAARAAKNPTFIRRTLEGILRAFDVIEQRAQGKVIATPQADPREAHGGPVASLRGLLDAWAGERKPMPKTLAEWELVVRRFEELRPGMPLSAIQKRDVVAFKDKLVKEGAAPATVKKQLGAIKALLQYASDNDLLPANPGAGVKVAVSKVEREQRLPYSADDLEALFSGAVHKGGERPTGGAGEAAYWLPILALHTGARLEELGQLTRDDVKSDNGTHYLLITDRGEGTRVKAHASRRRVPLHPKLVKLRFLHYVQTVKAGAPLWPQLKANKMGTRTQAWSKWFNRYADSLGINDPRKVFHSFRHAFKVACRAAGASEEVHDRLTGHAGGGVGRSYGSGVDYPLAPLAQAVKRLKFEGFPL